MLTVITSAIFAAEPPVQVDSLVESLSAAEASIHTSSSSHQPTELAALQDAATKLYRFFSSPDSLHAAFWVQHERVCQSADEVLEPIILQPSNVEDNSQSEPHTQDDKSCDLIQPTAINQPEISTGVDDVAPSQATSQHSCERQHGASESVQNQDANMLIPRTQGQEPHIHGQEQPLVDTGQDIGSHIKVDSTDFGVSRVFCDDIRGMFHDIIRIGPVPRRIKHHFGLIQ